MQQYQEEEEQQSAISSINEIRITTPTTIIMTAPVENFTSSDDNGEQQQQQQQGHALRPREYDTSSVDSCYSSTKGGFDSDTESVKGPNNVFLDVSMRVEDLVQQTRRQRQQAAQQQPQTRITTLLGGSSSGSIGIMSSAGGDSASVVSSTLEGLFEDSLALASQRKISRRRQHARTGRSRSAPKIDMNLIGEQEDSIPLAQLRVPMVQRSRSGGLVGGNGSSINNEECATPRDTWQEDLSAGDGSFTVPMTRPSCLSFHGSRHSLLSYESRSTSSLYSHQESLDDSSVSSFAVAIVN